MLKTIVFKLQNHVIELVVTVVNIQIPYEIFIYVEGGISDPNFEAG